MACMHLRKEKELVMLDDGVSHEYVVTCKSVCKEELSRQAVLCAEARNFTKIVSNGDVTHTITVTCECGRVISQVTETCTDSEDSGEACDVCNGALECRHPKTTASYEAVGEQKHTVTKTCDACGAVTSVEENVACADEDSDAACDLCGGPVEAVEPEPAPEPETT